MSADARVARAIIALRAAITAADDQILRDDQGRCPGWWVDLDMAAEALCGEARDALHMEEETIERWRDLDANPRWMCGCLINEAGAHRVGCPDHPQGVRGSGR
jgi:hypothetical protein